MGLPCCQQPGFSDRFCELLLWVTVESPPYPASEPADYAITVSRPRRFSWPRSAQLLARRMLESPEGAPGEPPPESTVEDCFLRQDAVITHDGMMGGPTGMKSRLWVHRKCGMPRDCVRPPNNICPCFQTRKAQSKRVNKHAACRSCAEGRGSSAEAQIRSAPSI